MKRHCQFTVKRSEKMVDLTVAADQQPCGVQVVEWVGLVAIGKRTTYKIRLHPKPRRKLL
jgi:hypothetical protein